MSVSSDKEHTDVEETDPSKPIDQTDKPRAGSEFAQSRCISIIQLIYAPVAAEYLARGYTLSDGILQRAIEIDSKRYLLDLIVIPLISPSFAQILKESQSAS